MSTTSAVSLSTLGLIVLLGIIAFCMWGCPQYGVYDARMKGQAELAQAQSNRQTLVMEAQAQREAATQFADATSQRINGWVTAAQEGCIKLGRPHDAACEQMLIGQAQLYSIAKEGGNGVSLVVGAGAQPTVAVK